MQITKTSPMTGKSNTMEIDITPDQLEELKDMSRNIQAIYPHLNADEREFLKTGYTPEDWGNIFPKGDDD